jgi:hypothetical protein
VNAFLFVVFGIVQRASGTETIYWFRPVGFPYFFSSLIYKNHAAAYVGLLTSVALGLTLRSLWRSRQQRTRSHPGIIFLLFTGTLGFGLILTFSFSGVVLFGAAFLAATVFTARHYFSTFKVRHSNGLAIISAVVPLLVAAMIGLSASQEALRTKTRQLFEGDGQRSLALRQAAVRQGWSMAKDCWLTGWGAGCFQYGFTKYQKRDAALASWQGIPSKWEHLHCDWLEFLIELGLIGIVPIVFISGFWITQVCKLRLWQYPAIIPLLCGLVALVLQAVFDFPLQNPAVAATACALLPLTVRWAELEQNQRKRG